ncbi:NADH-quinone oxidoreductase subunit NuoG [Candidatus Legionella polyplacis]|uniref:NADH-quinone oxidoreductase n=1 Tax=Candidatus Legionella polyplacis TaxID=2005262 RepID=A0ABZ2GWB4_9GAMM
MQHHGLFKVLLKIFMMNLSVLLRRRFFFNKKFLKMIEIEINNNIFKVKKGRTIIQVADDKGIYIPRFCYHKQLSLASNCRMCLVEIYGFNKLFPACSTVINKEIKIFTKSKKVIEAQKSVMEFLLINHPLDCPICDQGGECELQDFSMEFGSDSSVYKEEKRVFSNDNFGSLIASEMTRCIYCTRCIRFDREINGSHELGLLGKGEKIKIGTYIKSFITSEVSGNMIDLCPVGALSSKPFRSLKRSWELHQYDGVSIHDCLGSNIYFHVDRDKVFRVTSRENKNINECWISDRDRFSYLGLQSKFRASKPMLKNDGKWCSVDWSVALKFVSDGILNILQKYGPEQIAVFASPSSTLEEFYLLQKLMRSIGINNLDHRLQQIDFRDQNYQELAPYSSLSYSLIAEQKNILILGSNIHREVPLVGLKIREAFLNGAKLFVINPIDYNHNFDIEKKIILPVQDLSLQLAKLVLSILPNDFFLPKELKKFFRDLTVDNETLFIAKSLCYQNSVIITGSIFENHPDSSLLRTLLYYFKLFSGVRIFRLTFGSNSLGACISGFLPHRTIGGIPVNNPGMDVQSSLRKELKGYILLAVEPEFDFANSCLALNSIKNADFVVVFSAFQNNQVKKYASVLLPIAPYYETDGTYININNIWQTVKHVCNPYVESKPAWKIFRVLGNMLNCSGFEYLSIYEVLSEIKSILKKSEKIKYRPYFPEKFPISQNCLVRVGEWPLYRVDMIVRNSYELQTCPSSDLDKAYVRINPNTAKRINLLSSKFILVSQEYSMSVMLPVKYDNRVGINMVWIVNAMLETSNLGCSFLKVYLKKID